MRRTFYAVCFSFFGLLISCSGDNKAITNSSAATAPFAGVWQVGQSDLFSGPQFSTKYLQLNQDGTGTLFRQAESKVLNCQKFLYTVLSDSTLAISAVPADSPADGNQLFLYTLAGSDLTITSQDDRSDSFTKGSALPPGVQCKTFANPTFIRDLQPPIENSSGLAYDGTSLYFSGEDDYTYPFLLSSNTVDTGNKFQFAGSGSNPARYVHASQGTDFWGVPGSGHNSDTERRNRSGAGSPIDAIDTDTDLSHALRIGGEAFDGTNLWLIGNNDVTDVGEILKIDSNAEPDVVLQTFTFDGFFRGLAWDGAFLWTIANDGSVIKIDPASGEATATYEGLDPEIYWNAIAAVGEDLYLAGQTFSPNATVIAKVKP
jgi:hypothetical protein